MIILATDCFSKIFRSLFENRDTIRKGSDITAKMLCLIASFIFPSYNDFIALVAPQPTQGM